MKKLFILNALLATAIALTSCGSSDAGSDNQTKLSIDSISDSNAVNKEEMADSKLDEQEMTFIKAATEGGIMEVESANAAVKLSQNKAIKSFAEMMIKHHGMANKELEGIALRAGVKLPSVLSDEKMANIAGLNKLEGKKFDQQYMTMMIKDHAETGKMFTDGLRLQNPELSAFAKKTLPVIQSHYAEAVKIGKTLNLTNAGDGDDIQGVSPTPGHTN